LFRGINNFRKGYQPRSNLLKDEKIEMLADSNIFNFWKTFSQLLTVQGASDVRQIEIHTADPLVCDPILLVVEIAIAKLKRYKSPGSDQISAEPIQAGGEILRSGKSDVISGRSLLLYQFTRRTIKLSVIIIVDITTINFIPSFIKYPCLKAKSIHR
jgi:hypothetical protein